LKRFDQESVARILIVAVEIECAARRDSPGAKAVEPYTLKVWAAREKPFLGSRKLHGFGLFIFCLCIRLVWRGWFVSVGSTSLVGLELF
jgi:hypothetical protein